MFNNLNNFFNLKVLKRFKTVLELNDVIPLGTRDKRYDGGYKPTFMETDAFASQLCTLCKKKFLDLTDTPATYADEAGKVPVVKSTEDGLEFIDLPAAIDKFISLVDTPATYAGESGKVAVVKGTEDGLEFLPFPTPPADTNTWNMTGVAFVDPSNGNDATAIVGDGNKPFKNLSTASLASNIRILLPGSYYGNLNMAPGTYMCMPEVIFESGSRLRDFYGFGDYKILGHATFGAYSYGIQTSSGSNVYLECLDFNNTRSVAFGLGGGTINIKARNILCNTQNGAAYASNPREGCEITITCDQHYTNHWGVAFGPNASSGKSNVFNLNCPDIRVLNGGWVGNIAKSLINDQSSSSWPNISNINLMEGKLQNLHPVQTSSFGSFDSALLLYVNNTTLSLAPIHTFKNGTVYANAFFGLCHHYRVTVGRINLENLKVKSDTRALNLYLSNLAGNGNWVEHVFDNCMFESINENIIGNSQKCTFTKCTEKVTSGEISGIIDYNAGNPQQLPIVYFINSISQLDAGGGEFIKNAPLGATYGLINSPSTSALGAGVTDTWGGGYTPIPTLEIPNIL